MCQKLPELLFKRQAQTRVLPLLLTALVALLMASPILPAAETEPNYSMLDGMLKLKWSQLDSEDSVDLIIQFEDELREEDLATLRGLGFTLFESYNIIPGIHAKGTKEAVAELSHYERVWWIEYNQPLEYQLDVSTSTIRAAQTWDRIIKDYAGAEVLDTSGVPIPIDGSGVCIVVADTGIDATHPDLDYQEKVVRNLKKDFDDPLIPWIELPNTDNLFGHGTHCAGIAAGNGDASAGERKGVAPGATLIGLGIGDPWETNEIGCFDWVWENSRPDNNPYNIKVMTNSWGYEAEVDANFKDGVIQAANRLTYENNVIVAFAAGNDGGDGSESRSSIYANQPGMLCVAASYREGGGIASFSSRGERTENATWPDFAAPGVEIWSPRDTTGFIVNAVAGDTNPYYTAISGTSMATPHVAGVAALLWQAAPSMKFTSETKAYVEDHTDTLPAEWFEEYTDIHEMELILDLTADYIEPAGDNGVPTESRLGHHGLKQDFAQGYGQVNVERAVALALTLEEMRKSNPGATVDDAYLNYENILRSGMVQKETNAIQKSTNRFVEANAREQVSWFGEVIELDEIFYPQVNSLYVPEDAQYVIVDLNYDSPDVTNPQSGLISMEVDKGNGGQTIFLVPDITDPSHASMTLEVGADGGKDWVFEVHNVLGTRTEYRVNFRVVFPEAGSFVVDQTPYFRFAQEVDSDIIPGFGDDPVSRVTVLQNYFDLSKIDEPYEPSPESFILSVTVQAEPVTLSVYRSADPTVMVDFAMTAGTHEFSLPADELYFVRAQKEGYWDHTSSDVFLSRDRSLSIPRLQEKGDGIPYIHFSSLGSGSLDGVVKIGVDAGDEEGISSVELQLNNKGIKSWSFDDKPTQVYLDYSWDTRDYDDGDYTLKLVVYDAQGNIAEESRKVTIENDGGSGFNFSLLFLLSKNFIIIILIVVIITLLRNRQPPEAEAVEERVDELLAVREEIERERKEKDLPVEPIPEAMVPDAEPEGEKVASEGDAAIPDVESDISKT